MRTLGPWVVLFLVLGACHCDPELPDPQAVRAALGRGEPGGPEILALRVGRAPQAPRELFLADPRAPATVPVAFAFWLVKSGPRIILVDTGFDDPARVAEWGIEDFRSPLELLAGIGLTADQVTDVIVSHGHWDHIGCLDRFPRARVWRDTAQPLQLVAPGVLRLRLGRHTPDSAVVVLAAPEGPWVLAIDEAPLAANFERLIPSGQTSDPTAARAALGWMLQFAGAVERVVPGHEPGVFEGVLVLAPGVVRLRAAGP